MTAATTNRPRVLIVLDYYLPGVNAGGPVRSVANLVEHLGDEVDFLVATRDHDAGEQHPYAGITHEAWQPVGRAKVRYLSPRVLGTITRLVQRTPHDVLYLSSYFSRYSIELLWARRFGIDVGSRLVIAPRGQFGDGALALKVAKKRAWLALANLSGVHAGVTWHATNSVEAEQITRMAKPEGSIIVASNVPSPGTAHRRSAPKTPRKLRMVTVGRIHPMKNIVEGIRWLADVEGEIHWDVFGPHEDRDYLADCRRAAGNLPTSMRVEFPGPLAHADIEARLVEYDLFFLPTQGENFGHSIYEALAAGVPVLVSDRTPWRGLAAKGAGWDLPLDAPEAFKKVLRACVSMDAATHATMVDAARRTATEIATPMVVEALDAYRYMFRSTHSR